MIVRFAAKKDKKQVLDLLDELVNEFKKRSGLSPIPQDNKKRTKIYDEELKRNDIKIFVVQDNNRLVGVAELFIIPVLRRGYYQGVIESFIITGKSRGKGIGSLLLNKIFEYCKSNKLKVIKLTSSLELVDAHEFYEKHGGKFTEKMYRFDL